MLPIQNSEWQDYYVWSDPTDECPAGEGSAPFEGYVYGNVTDTSSNPLGQVIIEIGDSATYSDNTTGFYNMTVAEGNWSFQVFSNGANVESWGGLSKDETSRFYVGNVVMNVMTIILGTSLVCSGITLLVEGGWGLVHASKFMGCIGEELIFQ